MMSHIKTHKYEMNADGEGWSTTVSITVSGEDPLSKIAKVGEFFKGLGDEVDSVQTLVSAVKNQANKDKAD